MITLNVSHDLTTPVFVRISSSESPLVLLVGSAWVFRGYDYLFSLVSDSALHIPGHLLSIGTFPQVDGFVFFFDLEVLQEVHAHSHYPLWEVPRSWNYQRAW